MNSDSPDVADLLCWWHQYQAQRLNRTADLIRNGLMQELFALRRELELSCRSHPDAAAFGCDRHLPKLEHVYTQLEDFTNSLDSPFLKESLPLALQHTAQPWRDLPLSLDLPPVWESEPIERARLLMMFTEHLLTQLAAATVRPHQCRITLQQADVKQLTYRVAYAGKLPALWVAELSPSLTPFLKTFQLFTQGDYEHTVLAQEMTWVLRWQT